MKRICIIAIFLLMALPVAAREVYDLNRHWKFYTLDERDSVRVSLPHTWNNSDAAVGQVNYYRGTGNYFKYINARQEWRGKRVFIRFYGANMVTDLLVNGRYVGQHLGGSNAFEFEITNYLLYGSKNLLWVMVNNAARVDVLPTAGEENVCGGLFRKVELIVTDQSTIGLDGYGGNGVLFAPTSVNKEKASGTATVKINTPVGKSVQLEMRVSDARDSVVYVGHVKHKAEKALSEARIPFEIDLPHLWQGTDDPYLYKVTVLLEEGNTRDSVTFHTGLRKVSATPDKGLFLNGIHYPLRGVVLWRDQASSGPLFTEEQLRRDIQILREMGANAVRVVGGSHAREFYELCDREGIAVLAETPFTGTATFDARGYYNTPAFRENGMRQLKEMIYQSYNNPSVLFWGLFMEPEMLGDDPLPFIKEMHATAKSIDPTRLTVGVSNKDGDVNKQTDLIVWSHTFGWRTGMPGDIVIWRDQLQRDPEWSKVRSAVTYRAGGAFDRYTERMRKPDPQRNRHPENWQSNVHETYIKALGTDPKLWALFVGDLFDHGSVLYRGGEEAGVVNCGLVTADRNNRKDAYWLYKANWNSSDPFVYITAKRNTVRENKTQSITVYSNQPVAELFVGGVSKGTRTGSNGVFVWDNIQLVDGANELSAVSVVSAREGECITVEDKAVITYAPNRRM